MVKEKYLGAYGGFSYHMETMMKVYLSKICASKNVDTLT